jgi:hypothetical protein
MLHRHVDEQKIAEIMREFDFQRVHRTMTALGWTYLNEPTVPTVDRLRRTAKDLLRELGKDTVQTSTGGFTAYIENVEGNDRIGLQFVVTEWEVE